MKHIRCGVIGNGKFGALHLNKLISDPRVIISGIYDPFGMNRDCTVDSLKVKNLCTLLACSDAIFICSPPSSHFGLAVQALEHRCHIYIEKPFATSEREALHVLMLAQAASLVLQIGHQERLVLRELGFFDVVESGHRLKFVRQSDAGMRSFDVSVALDLSIHDLDALFCLSTTDPNIEFSITNKTRGSCWNTAKFLLHEGDHHSYSFISNRRSLSKHRKIEAIDESGDLTFTFDLASSHLMKMTKLNRNRIEKSIVRKCNFSDPVSLSVRTFLDRIDGLDSDQTRLMERVEPAVAAVRVAEKFNNQFIGAVA